MLYIAASNTRITQSMIKGKFEIVVHFIYSTQLIGIGLRMFLHGTSYSLNAIRS
jgi:hypothetical protein